MNAITIGWLLAGLGLRACNERPANLDAPALQQDTAPRRVTVMTQNLYVGADLDAVIAALASPDADDDMPALRAALATEDSTDFPARAGGVVAAIERERPDVVGLQEVSEIHVDLTGLGLPYAFNEEFLPIIMDSLAARGLRYTVAAKAKSIEAVPMKGVALQDNDVILVNTDRATVEFADGRTYRHNVGPVASGVALLSAFVEVKARIEGQAYWFASTHLESDIGGKYLDQLRAAQATELVAVLRDATPAFIMGDLNDGPGSRMYQVFQAAGFHDVWARLRPGEIGYTDGHALNLSDEMARFDRRIDYVWERGFEHPVDGLQGRVARVGVLPAERVDGPYYKLWMSDHAGLVAQLQVPPARGVEP
jgi:hypothetical protein